MNAVILKHFLHIFITPNNINMVLKKWRYLTLFGSENLINTLKTYSKGMKAKLNKNFFISY